MATAARTTEAEVVRRADGGTGYVDWGAILAGAAVATAIALALVAFGSTLGLSLTSFSDAASMPGVGVVIAIGLWLLWLQVTASLGGGYVAGRLRRRLHDAVRHESDMRDGMHGLVVWAVGILIGSLMAAWIATIGSMGAATVGSGAAANPSAGSAAVGMSDYYVDRLLRPQAAPAGEGEGATAPAPSDDRTPSAELRGEIGRLLTSGLVTSADSEDRSYLLQRLSAETGLPEQAVSERLDTTLAAMKARADQARRLSVLMGFITVASLLISAVAAWWAATKGGDHRDQGMDHSRYVSWR